MRLTSLFAILMLAIALPAGAQEGTASVTGTVVSTTGDKLVLRTATGEMTFMTNADTDRPTSLPIGTRVTVWYNPAGAGTGDLAVATKVSTSETLGEPGEASRLPATSATETRTTEARTTGTSMTGTVVSSTADHLVIRTSAGERTFMVSGANLPAALNPGTRVTVYYDRPAEPGAGHFAVASRVTTVEAAAAEERRFEEERAGEPARAEDELPGTAGAWPLLGWIGVVALAGGATLRVLYRRNP